MPTRGDSRRVAEDHQKTPKCLPKWPLLVEFPTLFCSTHAKAHSLALRTDQRPANTVSNDAAWAMETTSAFCDSQKLIIRIHIYIYIYMITFSIQKLFERRSPVQRMNQHKAFYVTISRIWWCPNQTPKKYQTITHKNSKRWFWFWRNNNINWKISVIPKGLYILNLLNTQALCVIHTKPTSTGHRLCWIQAKGIGPLPTPQGFNMVHPKK